MFCRKIAEMLGAIGALQSFGDFDVFSWFFSCYILYDKKSRTRV